MLKQFEVKGIYIWEYETTTEYIKYKMNADSNWNLYVPIGWKDTSWSSNCTYNRIVSVDGLLGTAYSWTNTGGWRSITLSWYTAWTSHTIKIKPTTEDYQRARAYWWWDTAWRTYLTEILYDSSYMWYAVSATNTWNYFRYTLYVGCTNLINSAEEYLPDTVTTIGNNFRNNEYEWCTSLTYASEESLPSSVTSIGTYFRGFQYQGCTALTQIKWWKNLSIGNSTQYRLQQFYGCTSNKTVKVLSDVWYASANSNTLLNSYVTSVSVPSAYLTNFKNTTNQPWYSITDSKFIWY